MKYKCNECETTIEKLYLYKDKLWCADCCFYHLLESGTIADEVESAFEEDYNE